MRHCTFFFTIMLAALLAHAAPGGENEPDVAKRYLCKKDLLGGVTIQILADRIGVQVSGPKSLVSTLTFAEPCELEILKQDRTLLADREGIVGKDDKGQLWKSRKVNLNGSEVFAFFRSADDAKTEVGKPPAAEPAAGKSPRQSTASPMRRWTDSSGRHAIEAEFVSMADGMVTLKKKNGATATLAVEKLSDADREWIKTHGGAEATASDGPTPEQCREFFAQHGELKWVGQIVDDDALPLGTMHADFKKRIDAKLFLKQFGKPKREVQAAPRSAHFVAGVFVLHAQRWEYERIGIFVFDGNVLEYYEFPQKPSQESSAAPPTSVSKSGPTDPTSAKSDSPAAAPAKAKKDRGFAALPEGWPKRSGDLSGGDEVRVKNPNDFQVRVGLRSGRRGKDFVVPADGVQSVFVPNGKYDIYFQYSTDPAGLYQGDSFTLADNGVEIQIVMVVNGNYGIRKVK